MESIFNGAGIFAALSAPLMFVGLWVSGAAGGYIRRTAIFLTVVLPLAFMITAIFVYHGDPQFDFNVNYRAALELYGHQADPYAVPAAYSFPFPTFYIYWVIGSALSPLLAWYAWWVVNGIIWVICAMLLWRNMRRATNALVHDMRLYLCVGIPAIVVLWQGQTALLILLGLVVLHHALTIPRRINILVGGIGLAGAALIKPQLALVGLGMVIWVVLNWRTQPTRGEPRAASHFALSVVIAAAFIALMLLLATLVLPGGVTFDTYQGFITHALPQVARASDKLGIGSPAFVAGTIANGLGVTDRNSDVVANFVSLGMVGFAAYWTWQQRHQTVMLIAAGWGVWAMVIPRVAWTWYGAWCLPFLLMTATGDRRRMAVLVIIMGTLSLQFNSQIIAFATIIGLIALLWTHHETPREAQI